MKPTRRALGAALLVVVALATIQADAAPKVIAQNTLTTVIGTQHSLAVISSPGNHQFKVSTCTLLAGDILEARVADKVIAAGPLEGFYFERWIGAQPTDECGMASLPFTTVFQSEVSLKQTAGSPRQIRWSVVNLGG